MGKVGQMVLEIQKEWMKQINEKNEIIKDLEERLEKQINAARDNYVKQGPLYRKIGLFAGVLAVIIFI